jgi:adenylate cyclase
MYARLERKLRLLAVFTVASAIGAVAFVVANGLASPSEVATGIAYGLLLGVTMGGISLFVLQGLMRSWLGSLSFTTNLTVRTAIYAAIIVPVLYSSWVTLSRGFLLIRSTRLSGYLLSTLVFVVLANLVLGVANIIGPRAFLNFVTGRYHFPVEESRFVLFVDIAGSTGLAERLGGIAIHRLLDRTFRLLTLAVVDYRGEVLNYVGDEVIVTWSVRDGAVDCRPLRCFEAMRNELSRASSQLEREYGTVPRIRGSLHFGPVIIGEIGDIKRAIVFNGDVMNTAARLEELSRGVELAFSRPARLWSNFGPPPGEDSRPRATSNSRTCRRDRCSRS